MLNYVKQVLSADLFPDIPGQAWAWQLKNLPYNVTQCTAEQRTATSQLVGFAASVILLFLSSQKGSNSWGKVQE